MNRLQVFVSKLPFGFLVTEEQENELKALDRLFPVLVRCGCCRFTCPVQDLAQLVKCIKVGGDYVRDVSLPVGSDHRAASWVDSCPVTAAAMLPASFVAPRPADKPPRPSSVWFNEADCGGVFDGSGVVSDADPGL